MQAESIGGLVWADADTLTLTVHGMPTTEPPVIEPPYALTMTVAAGWGAPVLVADAALLSNWLGALFITADHGNCEQMIHPKTGEIDKEHTVNPVPFILARPAGTEARDLSLESLAAQPPVGVLADVAPTVLEMLGIPIPPEMTGQSLVKAI